MQDRNIHSEYHDAQKLEPHVQPVEIVKRIANKYAIGEHQAALEAGLMQNFPHYRWPVINYDTSSLGEESYTTSRIITKDTLGDFVRSMSKTVQFPENTAFLHALGCIASAMVRNFSFNLYGNVNSPVTLYTISAQPPSSGKSGIHNYLTVPIRDKFIALNSELDVERKKKKVQLKLLEAGLKKAGGMEAANIEVEIEELEEELSSMAKMKHACDDVTPEALEGRAAKQGGFFNVLSPEPDPIDILIGGSYSGAGRKVNHGLILKAWDNEYFSPERVTRATKDGHYRGCFCVLGQDDGIKSVLLAGDSGRGISERILLMRERPLLGTRDHSAHTPIDNNLLNWYEGLCENLVMAPETVFTFTEKAKSMVNEIRNDIEQKMRAGGTYSSALMQGFCGKAGAQIYRIACVLHAARDWHAGGKRSTKVKDQTVVDAIAIFMPLMDDFANIVGGQGYAGNKAILQATIDALREATGINGGKKKTTLIDGVHRLSLSAFRTWKRGTQPFKGQAGFIEMLDEDVLPILSEYGICAYHNKQIYISPNLLT